MFGLSKKKSVSERKNSVFISHWNKERLLAEYIKDFLTKENKDLDCFCSSRDMTLGDWRKTIDGKARTTNIVLLMISPFSKSDEWIQYEAGIVYGSNVNNQIVPVLFGGANIQDVPTTINNHQALILNDENSFNSLVCQITGTGYNKSKYKKFISGMSPETNRLCLYGHHSLISPSAKKAEEKDAVFETDKQKERFIRKSLGGEIASVRLKMVPRYAQSEIHWKTGIKIKKGDSEIFVIHAGRHKGTSTWTIYHIPGERNFKYEIPAKLEMDSNCSISIWFENNRRNIQIELVDSSGKHSSFLTDTNSSSWNLAQGDWDSIEVAGWCDNEIQEYANMKYKTEAMIEVDRG